MALWGVALVPGYFVVRNVGVFHVGAEGRPKESVPSSRQDEIDDTAAGEKK